MSKIPVDAEVEAVLINVFDSRQLSALGMLPLVILTSVELGIDLHEMRMAIGRYLRIERPRFRLLSGVVTRS